MWLFISLFSTLFLASLREKNSGFFARYKHKIQTFFLEFQVHISQFWHYFFLGIQSLPPNSFFLSELWVLMSLFLFLSFEFWVYISQLFCLFFHHAKKKEKIQDTFLSCKCEFISHNVLLSSYLQLFSILWWKLASVLKHKTLTLQIQMFVCSLGICSSGKSSTNASVAHSLFNKKCSWSIYHILFSIFTVQ